MAKVIPLDEAARQDARFEQLVREQGKRLKNVVTRMVGPEEADDVLQEAFLQVYRGLASFRAQALLSTWAYRVTVNVCLAYLNRVRRTKAKVAYLELEEAGRNVALAGEPVSSPEAVAENHALSEVLRQGLLELSPDLRAVLVLRDIEGLSYRETASILGVPLGTAQSRLHKARAALREIVRSRWGGERT
ncbi:MAG: RNA polymerase sigma factor [Chitinophagales bacterium]